MIPVLPTTSEVGNCMAISVLRANQIAQSVVVPIGEPENIELSVVMPCLNEAETLETCIGKAQRVLEEAGIAGEVVVADVAHNNEFSTGSRNGSSDGSVEIASEWELWWSG